MTKSRLQAYQPNFAHRDAAGDGDDGLGSPMRFVYLDHGHYTFDDAKAGGGGDLLRLFRERCVFSGRLLRLL